MKSFEITEEQLKEMAGRLDALTVRGIDNIEHVAGIVNVLKQVAAQTPPAEPDANRGDE